MLNLDFQLFKLANFFSRTCLNFQTSPYIFPATFRKNCCLLGKSRKKIGQHLAKFGKMLANFAKICKKSAKISAFVNEQIEIRDRSGWLWTAYWPLVFLLSPFFGVVLDRSFFPHFSIMDSKTVQRSALCRSRRELSNEYLLAKFGFDTA